MAAGVSHLHIFAAAALAMAGFRAETIDVLEMVGQKLAGTRTGRGRSSSSMPSRGWQAGAAPK
jgi:hypothetical protein